MRPRAARAILCAMKSRVGAGLVLVWMAGCRSVGPDYETPDVPTPPSWAAGDRDGPADLVAWWTSLNDAVLTDLVEQTLQRNLDLKQARQRLVQARAALAVASGEKWPSVDAGASVSRARTGQTGFTSNLFSVGFDASWEIDVFGGIRRNVEAAGADFEGARYGLADVQISLVAEVGSAYVRARTLQARLAIARSNIANQEDSLELTNLRFKGGASPELDVAQARANLANTRATVPQLESALAAERHRLSVLTALWPRDIAKRLGRNGKIPQSRGGKSGIPAELLRRRPDIRAAERSVAAATARIGVATAELYPRFSLSGSFGIDAPTTGAFDARSRSWSIGPAVRWNVFDRGRRRAQVSLQEAAAREAALAYEQTVRRAIEEVENALTSLRAQRQRASLLNDAAGAARRSVELSDDLYRAGRSDFQNVLDAQRNQFAFEDGAVDARGAVTLQWIALYKALGGGWNPQEGIEPAKSDGEKKQ